MASFSLPGGRILQLHRGPGVMGILNVTPDSFSDGGVNFRPEQALQAAMQMADDGADVLDIGGESTRPGAEPVSADEEMDRVVPVIAEIRRRSPIPISIDTTKAAVASAAIDAGADIINDVSALRHDPAMPALAVSAGVPVVLMHMRGEPRTMQDLAQYGDVVSDVMEELRGFVEAAVLAGIAPDQILVDPGIGFAKTVDQNLEILRRCGEITAIAPVLIGASRKAFIGQLTGQAAGPKRMAGSLAAVAAAFRGNAAMVRVHDVRETVDFLAVMRSVTERPRA